MAEQFDPYHRWLGIRPEEQPADHYRLLGLARFEDDPEVIRDAAEQRIRHVRTYQLGQHRKLTQKVLNELAAARACLLDDRSRAEYDERLRQAVVEEEKRDRPLPPPIAGRFPAPGPAISTKPEDAAPWPTEPGKIAESAGKAIEPSSRRTSRRVPSKRKAPRQRDRHAVRAFVDLRKVAASVIAGAGQAIAGAMSGFGWPLTRLILVGVLGVLVVLSVIAIAVMLGLGSLDEPELAPRPYVPPDSVVEVPEKSAVEPPQKPAVEQPEPKEEPAEPKPAGGDAKEEPMAFMLGSRIVQVPDESVAKDKPEDRPAESVEKTAELPTDARKAAADIATGKTATRKLPADSPPRPALPVAPFDATEARRHQKAWADHLGVDVEITNSIGMRLVLIPPGEFMMGSPESEQNRYESEHQHRVRITKGFYLGINEVTQAEFEEVMGRNPSGFTSVAGQDTGRFPVEDVSWDDAVEFCGKLSRLPEERRAGRVYRLPTEAEWEYACRAGTTSVFHFGDTLSSTQANFNGDHPYGAASKGPYLRRPAQVGSYQPNAWGLFDMHGNIWEWCSDRYADYYRHSPVDDPQGPLGVYRVLRGGSWCGLGRLCRSAYRDGYGPGYRDDFFGVRVALGR